MRHGYYLKRKRYAYSGTKEFTVKKLGSKENRKWKTCVTTERKSAKSQTGRTIRTAARTIRTELGRSGLRSRRSG